MEVAKELLDVLGLTDKVKMTEVSSDYFKDIYFAPRPPSERLVNKKLDLRGINTMRDWRLALAEYIDLYFNDYLKDKL
jgi:dTDP-4-dehydrorhamnose reductase